MRFSAKRGSPNREKFKLQVKSWLFQFTVPRFAIFVLCRYFMQTKGLRKIQSN